MLELIDPEDLPTPESYTHVVSATGSRLVFVAGQVAEDNTADIKGQTAQVLAAIDKLLAEAGTSKSKILSTTIYLASIGNFAAMNEVWDAWVDQSNPPARATVEARLATPGYLVEIVCVAAI